MDLDIDIGYNDVQSLLYTMFCCCIVCTKICTMPLASVDVQFFLIGHFILWAGHEVDKMMRTPQDGEP